MNKYGRGPRLAVLGLALVLGLGVTAGAGADETVASLPLATYAAPPEFVSARLSPDGRYLAALAPIKGKRNLVVLDLQTRKPRAITAITANDVIEFNWVGSGYLVYSLGRLDTPTGAELAPSGGPFAVRVDGSGFRELGGMSFLRAVPGSNNEILVNARFGKSRPDIYRVNLDSGERKQLSFDKPGHVQYWVLDNEGVPRAVVIGDKEAAAETEQTYRLMLRDKADSPWRELASWREADAVRPVPRVFAPDNRNLIVEAAPGGRATTALYIFDVEQKKLGEMVAGHPRFDASETTLVTHPLSGQVIGLRMNDDRYQAAYFDEEYAKLQGLMEGQFKDQAVAIQRTSAGLTLVTAWSDRQPHRYYLYDEGKKSLELLLRSRRDIDERHLVEMRPFLLKTRDGLEIPSYYFLPANHRPGQKLPTVVHIHGGPHVRADHWGPAESTGAREAQILASRGYAVVVPNFRMTPGLGSKIYNAGWGEYGRKMSDDHEDAAHWAVAQGFADPKRICISGSSYGGSASLWATIKSADVFACAVAGLVVSDKKLQLNSTLTDYASSESGVALWKRILGVKGDDWTPANEVAPALHAERSRIPLFLYAGGADRRTPLEQTKLMVDALKKAGKAPDEVLIKMDEAHGYGKLENRVELYEKMLNFLDKHIGPARPAAGGSAAAPGAQ